MARPTLLRSSNPSRRLPFWIVYNCGSGKRNNQPSVKRHAFEVVQNLPTRGGVMSLCIHVIVKLSTQEPQIDVREAVKGLVGISSLRSKNSAMNTYWVHAPKYASQSSSSASFGCGVIFGQGVSFLTCPFTFKARSANTTMTNNSLHRVVLTNCWKMQRGIPIISETPN